MCGQSGRGEGGDKGVLILKSVCEGVKGGVVDWDYGNGGGKGVGSAGLTGEDCDGEAGFKELVEDGWAEVACGLRVWLLVGLK